MTRPLPPVVITASRLLRDAVSIAEQHCGLDFDHHVTLAAARRHALRREAIILGGDLVARSRKPWHCRGVVLAVTVGPWTPARLAHAERVDVRYVIDLPTGLPALVDAISRAHRDLNPRPGAQAPR